MSDVVLDSGILIASVYPETFTEQAQTLIRQLQANNVELHAPTLLHYELIAVSRKAVYQGRVTPEEGLRARDSLLAYPITLHFEPALLRRAYALAAIHNRPTAYDTQYVAVAEYLQCAFWTVDERLYNAIKGSFSQVRWIGSISTAPDSENGI